MNLKCGLLTILLCTSLGAQADELVRSKTNNLEAANLKSLVVYKNPTCGCCDKWIEHVEANEFSADVRQHADLNDIKRKYGIAPQNQSCHTAVHDSGYVFEGHIPAEVISRFLDHPVEEAIGLAVPGMPLGSPGMEYGDRINPYVVRVLMKDGSIKRYATVSEQGIEFNL